MSTLVAQTISNGTVSTSSANVIQGSAKAWVNFNGTTASPSTIRASYNVTSITKNGTGDFTVNLTNALSDANYAINVSNGYGTGSEATFSTVNTTVVPTTTAFRFKTRDNSANLMDCAYTFASVFR